MHLAHARARARAYSRTHVRFVAVMTRVSEASAKGRTEGAFRRSSPRFRPINPEYNSGVSAIGGAKRVALQGSSYATRSLRVRLEPDGSERSRAERSRAQRNTGRSLVARNEAERAIWHAGFESYQSD